MRVDAVAVVEASYDFATGDTEWLENLLDTVGPELDRGFGLGAWRYRVGRDFEPSTIVHRNMPPGVLELLGAELREHGDRAGRAHSAALPFATASQALGIPAKDVATHPLFVSTWHAHGVRDCGGINAFDPSGTGVLISIPQPDVRRPSRAEATRWSRIAAHIVAGARLRDSLDAPGNVVERAEAVLSPGGRVLHAEPEAQSAAAQETLRAYARDIDRARGRLRHHDEDEALSLWRALIGGRWSLVDHFDSDGRRFVVARKNEPAVRDPRTLSRRERQVLAYALLGHPLKLIAYELGIGISTVAAHRASAMRKLGDPPMHELARLFSQKPRPVVASFERSAAASARARDGSSPRTSGGPRRPGWPPS